MMSLSSAEALQRKLEEEHDFNAKQANGTLIVVDQSVESGIGRVLESIEALRSEMDARFDITDKRLDLLDKRLTTGLIWQPMISTFYTLLVLGAIITIAYRLPDTISWFS